ncbi:MAG: CPBP family intramembrane metalloprotease [Myxococcales bacterium]|nr:CPBP family intramembrane metalloprotease [Myxococcales bacterium]MCB9753791.1 CPBP family intramembrane metalloprotease [Myxococcales bacterium]
MREIIAMLRAYARAELDAWSYGLTGALLLVALVINYSLDFETTYISTRFLEPIQIVYYALYYAVPFVAAIVIVARARGRGEALRDPGLWLATLVTLVGYGVYRNFHYYGPWIQEALAPEIQRYVFICAANLLRAALGFALVLGFWLAVDRRLDGRAAQPLYGLSLRSIALRPYLLMLAIISPLIAWASFQPAFLAVYPRYTPGPELAYWGLEPWVGYAIFELCYGTDFVFTELFFRGLLVLGFARWLGPGAVLPMVAFYAFVHFEKPLGEALGSIFGGWVLGVIAYRTRSIAGGVVIHLGVAYLMELAAILQRTLGAVAP